MGHPSNTHFIVWILQKHTASVRLFHLQPLDAVPNRFFSLHHPSTSPKRPPQKKTSKIDSIFLAYFAWQKNKSSVVFLVFWHNFWFFLGAFEQVLVYLLFFGLVGVENSDLLRRKQLKKPHRTPIETTITKSFLTTNLRCPDSKNLGF